MKRKFAEETHCESHDEGVVPNLPIADTSMTPLSDEQIVGNWKEINGSIIVNCANNTMEIKARDFAFSAYVYNFLV